MKKLLPHLPMFGLVFGLLFVQIYDHTQGNNLLSDSVATTRNKEETGVICTKPEAFSTPEETAWCTRGLASGIRQNLHNWNWSCLVGEETYSCHFKENRDYRTHGGVLFKN